MGSCLSKGEGQGGQGEADSTHLPEIRSASTHPVDHKNPGDTLRAFNFNELEGATQGLSQGRLLGQGSFGKVYRGEVEDWTGELPPGQMRSVAIKVLSQGASQGYEEWMTEIQVLGRLSHPNLVRLWGYSSSNPEWALVYEFVPNETLETWLFRVNATRGLTWMERMRVAQDITVGLGFLHQHNVIHRDLKPSNILLADSLTAKLADFGLATEGPGESRTHISTRILGTLGYLDPMYALTGHLTTRSDVFSLGCIFLGLLTGKPPVGKAGDSLMDWIYACLVQHRLGLPHIVDPRLQQGQGQYPLGSANRFYSLAKHCASKDPNLRPSLAEIQGTLKAIIEESEAHSAAAVAQGTREQESG